MIVDGGVTHREFGDGGWEFREVSAGLDYRTGEGVWCCTSGVKEEGEKGCR